jgi:putative salt-induced outer membrane protein
MLVFAATVAPTVAWGQDDAPPPVQFTGDLGFVNTAGNSEVTTLNLGERLTYRTAGWVLGEFFNVIYGETDGEESTSLWKAGARVDREITPRLTAFGLAGWERNKFAGISRRFEEAVGLAYKVLVGEKSLLDFEAGVSLNQQRSTLAGVADNNFVAGRAAGMYRYNFSESAFLTQLVEFLPNLEESDDYRLNSETALVAALSKQIALKLGYVVRFDNLPELGFKKTDRLFTSGIQVNF